MQGLGEISTLRHEFMRRILVSVCLLAFSLALAACAPSYSAYYAYDPTVPYRLASGDRVRVIVYGQEGLSNSYSVDNSGRIQMPLIGLVSAQGETTAALGQEIDQRLRDGFLRDPHVSVEVEAYRPFFILGEVTTPGQYPYVNGMTAQTAVAIAGGFTPRADKDDVDVTRAVNGTQVNGRAPIRYPVQPGDTIVVRERFF
jgi:polysaccharide biosynthesis/export protein